MKLIRECRDIVDAIQDDLTTRFMHVDVGCAYNGIASPLLDFGDKLEAYAFDANSAECLRLSRSNNHRHIHYIPATLKTGVSCTPPAQLVNNPWLHLAVAQTLQSINADELSTEELTNHNLWARSNGECAAEEIFLSEYLSSKDINKIDLCKIDVDGEDFLILKSLETYLSQKKILAIVIEVNFFGSGNESDNTYHNIDRYLRAHSFDLYGLTINKYSARSLPFPYFFGTPGENVSGRPYQGDALYVLDPFFGDIPDKESFLKLIAVFCLFGLPDWAAEIIQLHGGQYLTRIKKYKLLDLLTHQVSNSNYPDYTAYINAFNNNDPYFYGSMETSESLRRQIQQLRTEVNAYKTSASWRVTKPLRFISEFARSCGICKQ